MDDETERRLRKQLTGLLRQHGNIERAYLARGDVRGESAVLLCIVTVPSGADANIEREVADIVASSANAGERLVTLFISEAQEGGFKGICAPFYFRKSWEEVVNDIASVRALAQPYLASEYAFLPPLIRFVIKWLDEIEARVRGMTWPPGLEAFDDINIGLYAVRNLDEIDDRRLSGPLCRLDYTLKHL